MNPISLLRKNLLLCSDQALEQIAQRGVAILETFQNQLGTILCPVLALLEEGGGTR